MRAKRVDRLSLLADQKGARFQHHRSRLLFGRFDRNEAHGLAGTASLIASASAASVLPLFTNGFT